MQFISFGVAAALCLLATGAQATTISSEANLKGSTEVPANTTKGTGTVDASLDTSTKMFSYTATYAGLTGPATAAHFHGPAAPGVDAPPIIGITALASPIKGSAKLTDVQITDLTAGKWYFNVHTAAHPAGEIRGQLLNTP